MLVLLKVVKDAKMRPDGRVVKRNLWTEESLGRRV